MTKTVRMKFIQKVNILFDFKIGEDRNNIDEYISQLSKTVIDRENIGVEVDDEDQVS